MRTESKTKQPTIVNFATETNAGIQSTYFTRFAISYISKGRCYLYDADRSLVAHKGDLIFFNQGHHHIEQMPGEDGRFEQITFYIDSEALHRAASKFTAEYNITISSTHVCSGCRRTNSVVDKGNSSLDLLFESLQRCIPMADFKHGHPVEEIKLMELLCIILTGEDSCLKTRVIDSIDSSKSAFEQIIQDHILKESSVAQLASLSNRSMTSFKKEFKRIYGTPPHQWYLRQRLNHARLLLISTKKSVAEVGIESTFPNTSHFIKLFRKSYDTTPAQYRQQYAAAQRATAE